MSTIIDPNTGKPIKLSGPFNNVLQDEADRAAYGGQSSFGGESTGRGISRDQVDLDAFTSRGMKYIIGTDNEERLAEQFGVGESLANGLGRLAGTTLTKTATGFSDLLIGLPTLLIGSGVAATSDSVSFGDIYNAAFNNDISKGIQSIEESIKETLPIYNQKGDTEKNFLHRALTDLEYWTDDMVDGAAFMASAWITGMGAAKALSPLTRARYAKNLNKLKAAAESELAAGIKSGENALKYEKALALAGNGTAKTLTTADRLITSGFARAVEGITEGRDTYDQVYNELLNATDVNGNPLYTEEDAKNQAALAAMITTGLNMPLMAIDYLQAGNLFKKYQQSTNKLLTEVVDETGKKTYKLAKGSRAARFGKAMAENAFTEGIIDEGLQAAIQNYAKKTATGEYGYDMVNLMDEYLKGFTTKEGWDAMGAGMILGGIFGAGTETFGPGAKAERKQEEAVKKAFEKFQDFDNINLKQFVKPVTNVEGTVTGYQLDEKAVIVNMMVMGKQSYLAKKAEEYLAAGNATAAKAYQDLAFANWANAHFEAGMAEELYAKIDEIGKLNEDQLLERGYIQELSTDGKGNNVTAQQIASEYKMKAQEYQTIFDNLSKQYKDLNYHSRGLLFDEAIIQKNAVENLDTANQKIREIQVKLDKIRTATPDLDVTKSTEAKELDKYLKEQDDAYNTLAESYKRTDELTNPDTIKKNKEAAERRKKEEAELAAEKDARVVDLYKRHKDSEFDVDTDAYFEVVEMDGETYEAGAPYQDKNTGKEMVMLYNPEDKQDKKAITKEEYDKLQKLGESYKKETYKFGSTHKTMVDSKGKEVATSSIIDKITEADTYTKEKRQLAFNSRIQRQYVRERGREIKKEVTALNSKIESINKTIENIKNYELPMKVAEVKEAVDNFVKGKISKAEFNEVIDQLNQESKALEANVKSLESEKARLENDITTLEAKLSELPNFSRQAAVEEIRAKKYLIDKLNSAIVKGRSFIDSLLNTLKEWRDLLAYMNNFYDVEKNLAKGRREPTDIANEKKRIQEQIKKVLSSLEGKKKEVVEFENALKELETELNAYDIIANRLSAVKTTTTKTKTHTVTQNPDTETSDESQGYEGSAKPVLSVVGLAKTAGAHYILNDKGEEILNPEPSQQRFFAATYRIPDKEINNYRMKLVLHSPETAGLWRESEDHSENNPRLVLYRVDSKTKAELYPVDENLNPIIENEVASKGVYTSMAILPDNRIEAREKIEKSFSTKNMTADSIMAMADRYKLYRATIINAAKQGKNILIPITGKSKGVLAEGPALTPVAGVLTKGKEVKDVKLTVATADRVALEKYDIAMTPGTVFTRDEYGNVIPLRTTRISQEKANILADLIVTYIEQSNKNKETANFVSAVREGDTKIDQLKIFDIVNSLLYFGTRTENTAEDKGGRAEQRIGLHNGILFFGSIEIPENRASEYRDQMAKFIAERLYHVSNKILTKDNKKPFYEPTSFRNGKLTYRVWDSYVEFLLSDKHGAPAVQVSMDTKLDVPLKNMYLILEDNVDTVLGIEKKDKKKETKQESKSGRSDKANTFLGEVKKRSEDSEVSKNANKIREALKNKDSKTILNMVFGLNDPTFYPKNLKFWETSTDLINNLIDIFEQNADETSFASFKKWANTGVVKVLGVDLNKWDRTDTYSIEPKAGNATPFITDNDKVSENLKNLVDALSGPDTGNADRSSKDVESIINNGGEETSTDVTSLLNNLTGDYKDLLNNSDSSNIDEAYRLITTNGEYEVADVTAEEAWFKARFPNVDFKVVKNLIDGKAFGRFKNAAVYIYENAEVGTTYHEAFHAAFRLFLSNNEIAAIRDEFRRREGEGKTFKGETKKFSDYSNIEIEEHLAEEFRDYVLLDGKMTIPKAEKAKESFFRRLLNFIKELFFGPQSESKIEELYKNINSGVFTRKKFVRNEFSNKPDEAAYSLVYKQNDKAIKNVEFTNMVMDGMTNLLFRALSNYKIDFYTIDNLLKKDDKKAFEEAYKKIYDPSLSVKQNQEAGSLLITYMSQAANKINKVDQKAAIGLLNDLKFIVENWNQTLQLHSNYLGKLGVNLNVKEDAEGNTTNLNSDVLEVNDDGEESKVKDSLGAVESVQYSAKDNASSTIKLLIATTPETTLRENAKGEITPHFVYNALGLPTLSNMSKTFNILLESLSNKPTTQEVIDELNNLAIDNPVITTIKNRLGKFFDPAGTVEQHILQLQFLQTFNQTELIFGLKLLDDNGSIQTLNVAVGRQQDSILMKWKAAIPTLVQKPDSVLTIHEGKIMIDGAKLLAKYPGKLPNVSEGLRFLADIGITFTDRNAAYDAIGAEERESINRIFTELTTGIKGAGGKTISNLHPLSFDKILKGRLEKLTTLEAELQPDVKEVSHVRSDGKTVYSYTRNNFLSMVVNFLNNTEGYKRPGETDQQALFRVLPHLNSIDSKRSQILKLDGLLFDANGNRNEDFKIELGIAEEMKYNDLGETGIVAKDLSETDRVVQEIDNTLEGVYHYIRPADKSLEHTFKLGKFVPLNNIDESIYITSYLNKFKDHLKDELERYYYLEHDDVGKDLDKYNKMGLQLGMFENIFDQGLLESLKIGVLELDSLDGLDSLVNSYTTEIDNALGNEYIDKSINELFSYLTDLGIIKKLVANGNYKVIGINSKFLTDASGKSIDEAIGEGITKESVEKILKTYFVNHQLGLIEQFKLFTGNLAFYGDPFKRFSAQVGTKKNAADSVELNDLLNTRYFRKDGKISNGKINTVVLNDVESSISTELLDEYTEVIVQDLLTQNPNASRSSLVKKAKNLLEPYTKINEADGQGYITLDEYREFLLRVGDWSNKQEKAYAKVINGETENTEKEIKSFKIGDRVVDDKYNVWEIISQDEYDKTSKLNLKSGVKVKFITNEHPNVNRKMDYLNPDSTTYIETNTVNSLGENTKVRLKQFTLSREESALFQPLKPQYFGPQSYKAGNKNLYVPTFYKFSVMPLYPSLVKNTTALKDMYDNMVKNQIGLTVFESGNKVGKKSYGSAQDFYTKEGGFNVNALSNSNLLQELDYRFMGIQVDIAQKVKDEVVFGTQMRKLMLSNMFSNGNPKPYRRVVRTYTDNSDGSVTENIEVTETSEKNTKDLIREYNDLINNITDLAREELFDDLGLVEEGKQIKITDITSFKDTLRQQAIDRGVNSNILEAIEDLEFNFNPDSEISLPLDLLPNKAKVEQIINSLLNNRIIRSKMNGGAKIQGAVSGFELGVRKLTETDKKSKWYSDTLKTYRKGKAGETKGMQILLPHYFKELIGKDLKITDIKDPRLLRAIGFRIPTQGRNALELTEIVGFLPQEAGELAIVAGPISAKAGSDYDIDKLNMFLPNYNIVSGEPKYKSTSINTEDSTSEKIAKNQNALIELMTDILSSPDTMADLITPNSAHILKEVSQYIQYLNEGNIGEIDSESFETWIIANTKQTMSHRTVMSPINIFKQANSFLVGKAGVGITALQITGHSQAQMADIAFNPNYSIFENGEEFQKTIQFELPINRNYNGHPSLAGMYTKDGYLILDVLSQFVNAYVDVAKDPFILNMNGGTDTANIYLMLTRLGVPIKTSALFLNQPSIKKYLKARKFNESIVNKANNEGGNLTDSRLIEEAQKEYKKKLSDLKGSDYLKVFLKKLENPEYRFNELTDDQLKRGITKPLDKMNSTEVEHQLMYLKIFKEYSEYAKLVSLLSKSTNVDTAGLGKSVDSIDLKIRQIEKVIRTNAFFNYKELFDNSINDIGETFIGKFNGILYDASVLHSNFWISKHSGLNEFVKDILDFYTYLGQNKPEDDIIKILNTVKNDFLIYLLQRDNQTDIDRLFVGDRTTAKQLAAIFKSNSKIKNNLFLQQLIPVITNTVNAKGEQVSDIIDTVISFNKKLDTYDENMIIQAFDELYDAYPGFGEDLIKTAIYQTGLNTTAKSWVKYLSYSKYKDIYKPIIEKYRNSVSIEENEEFTYIEDFKDMFYRNNYKNDTLVPAVTKMSPAKGMEGKFSIASATYSKYPFLKQWVKGKYSATERRVRKEQGLPLGKWELYKKLDDIENGAIYKKISTLGAQDFQQNKFLKKYTGKSDIESLVKYTNNPRYFKGKGGEKTTNKQTSWKYGWHKTEGGKKTSSKSTTKRIYGPNNAPKLLDDPNNPC